ncbi:MAG: flagellar biosynthetic protein FliO [Ghiorsea sp.]|nr:flagellar biosynthetic protein FliO [Ghiorsea sp.]
MGETSFAVMMAQSIGALALVLAIFAGLVWLMRRFQDKIMPVKEGKMQVVQRLHIDSKNSVVEIKHGQRSYLLGVGVGGIHKIADISMSQAEHKVKTDA